MTTTLLWVLVFHRRDPVDFHGTLIVVLSYFPAPLKGPQVASANGGRGYPDDVSSRSTSEEVEGPIEEQESRKGPPKCSPGAFFRRRAMQKGGIFCETPPPYTKLFRNLLSCERKRSLRRHGNLSIDAQHI